MSIERHFFPGSNTTIGFSSYYNYFLNTRVSNKIVILKGGPGTGKSTFMMKIANILQEKGKEVDFLHCSGDPLSLDGIVIDKGEVGIFDGTSPHIMDPKTPGAVDVILDFGKCLNHDELEKRKDDIISYNEECSRWYKIAYNYLNALKPIYDNLKKIYRNALDESDLYKLSGDIINRELLKYPISLKKGEQHKSFASAITNSGVIHHLDTLFSDMKKVYLVEVPLGFNNDFLFNRVLSEAVYRGFKAECYYCSIDPCKKIEHLIIPELKIAISTTIRYHNVEPWEIEYSEYSNKQSIFLIDIGDYMSNFYLNINQSIIKNSEKRIDELLNDAISALIRAKENHDLVEKIYIDAMDFNEKTLMEDQIVKELTM